MTQRPHDIVILGLTLSSSWGNGHATTFRALLRGLKAEGHRVLFLERDVPWYANNRDFANPDFCELAYYEDIGAMLAEYGERLAQADAVIVGSYVPEGVALIDALNRLNLKRLCFYDIDTPVTLAKLRRGEEDYLAARQIKQFDAYFSFTGGPTLGHLRRHYGVPQSFPLFCSVDDNRYQPTGEPKQWDLGYLGTYSDDRQPTLERLLIEPARRLPHLRFVVAGPQYPDTIEWPENVERLEHVGPAEHPSFYSRQRFTLNVTRADMIEAGWSPSVRLFEAAACGTPIISDTWEGLSELLPDGRAIAIARTSDDVVAALTSVSNEALSAMAKASRSIVLQHHTGLARARELVADLEKIAPRPVGIQPDRQKISA
ncbi:glycosyltransferase [Rhizobium helianthi]|uniref:Glycosyltransferase n=1 Tax=Rhizobium helianthi TaxID=1132695 RepID=A0ABW4M5Q5_9HYPH